MRTNPKALFKRPWPLFLPAVFLCLYGCKKYAPYLYQVTAIQLFNADNSGPSPVEVSTGPVPAKAYAIGLQYTSQITGSTKDTDPNESNYSQASQVNQFNIYSLSDFDGSHKAGVSLNDYFLYGQAGQSSGWVNAADSIAYELTSGLLLASYRKYSNTNTSWPDSAYLVLMQPPAVLGYRTFVVNIAFADNTRFTDTLSVTLE